jgi:AcrR family transcriptional regulator
VADREAGGGDKAAGAEEQRQAHKAARRDELLDAAVAAIRRDGPGTSMEAMAAAAGVTKPILYRHFGDRDGLVTALADRYSGDLVVRIGETLGEGTEISPRALVRGAIETYVSFIEADTALYRFMVLQAPKSGLEVSTLIDRIARRVAPALANNLPDLPGGKLTTQIWAYGIVGTVHQAGDWWVASRPVDHERLVDDLTRLVWGGLQGYLDSDA